MAQKIYVVFILILIINCSKQDLKFLRKNTDHFYNDLIKKYNTIEFDNNIKDLVDHKVQHYHKVVLKKVQDLYTKNRFLKNKIQTKGADLFQNFEKIVELDMPETKDMIFFKKYVGYEQWFAVTLKSSSIFAYEIMENNKFVPATSGLFVENNSTRIHGLKLPKDTFIIVEKPKAIGILYLFPQNKIYSIKEIQNMNVPDEITHLSYWKDTDRIYLSISTSSKIYIYVWQENAFMILQTFSLNSIFLKPYQIDNSIFLITSGKRKTTIFKYHGQTFEKFQIINKPFVDAVILNLMDKYFLCLTSEDRAIVYELLDDKTMFVPVQEIAGGGRIISIISSNTTLLAILKNHKLSFYQFNGQGFEKSNYKEEDVNKFKVVSFFGEECVLLNKLDGTWTLSRLKWMKAHDNLNVQRLRQMKQWCLDTRKKINQVVDTDDLNKIMNKKNMKLKIKKVNGIGAAELYNLTRRYEELISRIKTVNESLTNASIIKNPRLSNMQAQTVRVKCTGKCSFKNLVTDLKCDFSKKIRRINNVDTQTLRFEHVRVDKLTEFLCPEAGIKVEEIKVKGLLNGIDFDDFQKNVLKTSGDQVVTGEHIFQDLHPSSLRAPNIDIASIHSRQKIKATKIHAKELTLADGGLLLPIDGEPVTMTGNLTVARAKFNGPIHLRGGLRGNSIKRFSPMVNFPEARELSGNYTFINVRIGESLSVHDVARKNGKSIRQIKEEALSLSDPRVPVKLSLKSNLTKWKNISADNFPDFVTKNSNKINITGEKIALKDVTMPNSLYSKLPAPELKGLACSVTAAVSNIKTSGIKIVQAEANHVVSNNTEGASELYQKLNNSVTSLDQSDLSKKIFVGMVQADNLNIFNLKNSLFWSFNTAKFNWSRPNYIGGSLDLKKLKIKSLKASKGLKIPCPLIVEEVIVIGNLKVRKINGINFDEYVKDIARINDTIFMKKIIFDYLDVDEIQVADSNIDLQEYGENIYLGNKEIMGILEIEEDLTIPNILSYPPENQVKTYLLEGSIGFKSEPSVKSLNGNPLRELSSFIWTADHPVKLMENYFFKNISIKSLSNPLEMLYTPNFGSWKSLEKRILNKFKMQEIFVPAYFKSAKIPNIIARENSSLQSFDLELNELIFDTLKKHENQIIKEQWHIDELVISDHVEVKGRINNLNFSTDVARHSVKINKVTGIKVVDHLTVRNLMGLNFEEWSNDVFVPSNSEKLTIQGKKIFDTFIARNLKVKGKIMNKKFEYCLQQNIDQVFFAPKVIDGSLHARSIMTDGFINDINFTNFINDQLKDYKPHQTIRSAVVINKDLNITGDLKVVDYLEGIEMEKINSMYETFMPTILAIKYIEPFALTIEKVTKHCGKYWSKFEQVQDNYSLVPKNLLDSHDSILYPNIGKCYLIKNRSSSGIECETEEQRFSLKKFVNTSELLMNQLLKVHDVPLVVQVVSGPNSRIIIYNYSKFTNSLHMTASVRALGITEASVAILKDVVWIAVRFKSTMLVVRYEPWGDLQKFHLPATRFFALDHVPVSGELLLVRDDGMWKLDGLDGPRHEFRVSLLAESVETISDDKNFYIRMKCLDGQTKLLKARYVGV